MRFSLVAIAPLVACSTSSVPAIKPAPVEPVANGSQLPLNPRSDPDCVERGRLGGLAICGERYEAPSHGDTGTITHAHYMIENRSEVPETVSIVALDVVADPDRCAPGLDPAGQRRSLSITEVRSTPAGFTATVATIAPGTRFELDLFGHATLDDFLFHVRYHHEARFQVGAEAIAVRAGDLYYRYPHRRL